MLLPGVGIRYEFTTREGELVGVIVLRSGDVEVVRYEDNDPDQAGPTMRLDAEEAETLAQILGAPRITQRFADLSREIPGLESARIPLLASSPCIDRPLGDTRARTRTGASVVAVVNGDQITTSPGPDHVLRAGDVLVAIGTADGLAQMAVIAGQG